MAKFIIMKNNVCPNISTCRMVTTNIVIEDDKTKNEYIENWCRQSEETWQECKRFHTKKELSFCPDFVLPDTELTVEEISEKFDAQSLGN